MRKTILSVLLFTGLISCEKDTNSPQINSGLTGTWQWIRTDGGFAFHIHESPSTTGNTYLLKFIDENKMVIYENNTEILSGDYTIEKEKSIYSGEMEDYIVVTGEYRIQSIVINGIIMIDQNSLSISDNCYDGIGSSYKRIE